MAARESSEHLIEYQALIGMVFMFDHPVRPYLYKRCQTTARQAVGSWLFRCRLSLIIYWRTLIECRYTIRGAMSANNWSIGHFIGAMPQAYVARKSSCVAVSFCLQA